MKRCSSWFGCPLLVAASLLWSGFAWSEPPLWTEPSEAGDNEQLLRADTFVALSKRVSSSVVNILAFESAKAMLQGRGQRGGSGFLINERGYILTNAHVVDGCDVIIVTTSDGVDFEATLVGSDPPTDLALLKIQKEAADHVVLGDSDRLDVGEWVMAIGSPLGLDHTVTVGVISAKGRENPESYSDFVQTDASINPGNSGGPLFNLRGEVIAINTAINPFGQGISFAVPINTAKALLPMLAEGKVVRSWIGILVQAVPKEMGKKLGLAPKRGAVVSSVLRYGPADLAGLKAGDVITHFADEEVDERSLRWKASISGVGQTVRLELLRDGQSLAFELTLQELDKTQSEALPMPQLSEAGLGMLVVELNDELAFQLGLSLSGGLLILELEPLGAAALAGLELGDVLTEADEKPVRTVAELQRMLSKARSGDVLRFRVARGDSESYVGVPVP